jgi:hypothetical protein
MSKQCRATPALASLEEYMYTSSKHNPCFQRNDVKAIAHCYVQVMISTLLVEINNYVEPLGLDDYLVAIKATYDHSYCSRDDSQCGF